jgi:hypothetical protein
MKRQSEAGDASQCKASAIPGEYAAVYPQKFEITSRVKKSIKPAAPCSSKSLVPQAAVVAGGGVHWLQCSKTFAVVWGEK